MNREEVFHVENTEETKNSNKDICVLLLDSDATALKNMSETLRKRGYRVVATTRPDDLPGIINNQDEKIDLILAEFRLVEMNKYALLEKLKALCEIPAVGKYVKDAAIFYCLYRGARFYLKKPFRDSYLENLWQFKLWTQEDFVRQIDSNPTDKEHSITHTQPLGDDLKRDNHNNKVNTKDLDEYEADNLQSGDQKKPELMDEHNKGNKRKERAVTDTGEHTKKDYGSGLGDPKKPKLICATLKAIPNIEEANNEREEPTETKKNGERNEKEKPELVYMEEELEKWSTQPVTDFASYVAYEYEPLESVGESVVHGEIPLSPQESSNKEALGRIKRQNQNRALDEEMMEDGISLSDLEEGQGSTSDSELLNEIYTDLAKELKP